MKSEKVLRVIVMLLIGLFVCISIDFGIVLASTGSSVTIPGKLIQTQKPDPQMGIQNDVETNYSISVKSHSHDFTDLKIRGVESEEFTPNLYEWLWDSIPTH